VTYYRSFALQAAAASLENYQISMLEGLANELDNLYAALSLAYQRQLGDSAANLCQGMRVYWVTHGLLDEGIRWVQQFLSLPNLTPLARGILLSAQIPLLRLSGAWERTLQAVEEALPILPPDSDDAAAAYSGGGLAALDKGDFELARTYLQACYAIDVGLQSIYHIAITLCNLGHTYFYEGNLAAADQLYAEALERASQIQAELAIAHARYGRGAVAVLEQRPQAKQLLQQALAVLQRFNYKVIIAPCLEAFAAQTGQEGDYHQAGILIGAAQQVRFQHDLLITPGIAPTYQHLVAFARGTLNEQAWATALAAGQAMPLATAIDLALRQE
jgi:tetratricopeptide (TPR) repeat protein